MALHLPYYIGKHTAVYIFRREHGLLLGRTDTAAILLQNDF
jgi:hypothetical protein